MTQAAIADEGLLRAIGTVGLAASVINIVVGGSIFVLPAAVARDVGGGAPAAYLTGTVVMALVTLAFAEAGRRTARSGGPYAYVETAFGAFPGYLAGLLTWLAAAFASGAVAAALVDTVSTVAPPLEQPLVRGSAIALVFAVLALINVRGVQAGTRLASLTAVAKFSGLLLFVALAAPFVRPENLEWSWPTSGSGLGRATVLMIFALAGMEVPVCAGGEIRDPGRTVPRALAVALLLVVLLYITVHLVAQGVLGSSLATSQAPLADALARTGPGGRALLLATGAISMFGYLGGDMLGSSRILFAFGRDGLLPRPLGAVQEKTRSPHVAIWAHTVIAAGLAMSGTFTFLAPIASLTIVLLYIGCCAAAWTLARRPVPLLGIPGLLWVAAQSTRTEFLAVGAVLAAGSVIYWVRGRLW
ncbi:MAG TPA: APC family permease [Gemmatimonadales bacterium]|jgi:amino acid transporter